MLLEFTVQVKEIVHQDALPRPDQWKNARHPAAVSIVWKILTKNSKYNDMPKNKEIIRFDKDYYEWIAELSQRYRQSQIKAAIKVNNVMLKFYWSLGKDIVERQFENKYGSHFYETLSRDLTLALGNRKGLAPTSLWYAKSFYSLYFPLFTNLRQDAEDSGGTNFRQDAEEFELLFNIPWTHHQKIIDKVKGDGRKALFFVRKTSKPRNDANYEKNYIAGRYGAVLYIVND